MGTGDLLMRLAGYTRQADPSKAASALNRRAVIIGTGGFTFKILQDAAPLPVAWAGGGGIIGQEGCCQRLALTLFSSNGGKLLVLSSPFAKMTFLKPRLISVSPFNSYSCQSLAPTYSGTVLCVKLSW